MEASTIWQHWYKNESTLPCHIITEKGACVTYLIYTVNRRACIQMKRKFLKMHRAIVKVLKDDLFACALSIHIIILFNLYLLSGFVNTGRGPGC
jgi:hypothetical protein